MSYQVLARKWRPKSFETLVGQEHVVRALTNALQQNRLHHAYLFTGTRGVGKTTLARILAKSLNCEKGITATPCGTCSACISIDSGRFIDLIEVDAASNTQVDNMRDLLENAQYAPTIGRFKVYIIDEVHMLTRNSFNAMLKTLEEPPSHVKFILATTDPQKIPVTILSRCLQFNLRQMTSSSIFEHIKEVLKKENIPFEELALQLISRSASGSMRDALSLLDQAISFGGNSVRDQDVRSMLGAIDQSYLFDILNAISNGNGNELLNITQAMEQRSLSFSMALNDLSLLLQKIAIAQTIPESLLTDEPDADLIKSVSIKFSSEEIQLFYQIAILGKRDLGLAPDEYAGFSMCLLRMLAFRPTDSKSQAEQPVNRNNSLGIAQAKQEISRNPKITIPDDNEKKAFENLSDSTKQPSEFVEKMATSNENLSFDGNWRNLVDQLKLGLSRTLAQHCELIRFSENEIYLSVPENQKHLLNLNYQEKLSTSIEQYFGKKVKLHFDIGGTGNTPAKQISIEKEKIQSQAVTAIEEDGFVKTLIKDFGAQIIHSSIKPIQ